MALIKILEPSEAQKIRAGEVFDRPCALAREFLDNALDAGARNITLSIEEGGCRLVEVSDDGCGMDERDLELSIHEHATSKITKLDDLAGLRTMGFRGEALAAACAVSAVEILTSLDGEKAFRLRAGHGKPEIEPAVRVKGTTTAARYMFDRIPARKRFLKRPATEAALCKQIFLEKAAAFPELSFRYYEDGALKIFLPAAASYRERFAAAFSLEKFLPVIHEVNAQSSVQSSAQSSGFNAEIVIGGPGLSRQDKRLQFIFINKHKVQDWALSQALEAGLQGGFPNGEHPVGAIFLTVHPSEADFNVHPAKKEVKLQRAAEIHHVITSSLRNFLLELLRNESNLHLLQQNNTEEIKNNGNFLDFTQKDTASRTYDAAMRLADEAIRADDATSEPENAGGNLKFIGRLWGIFIIVEKNERLFIIDQHAAHERVLYDYFLSKDITGEPLLVPILFNAEEDESVFLRGHISRLMRFGFTIREEGNGTWRIETLPSGWKASDDVTIKEILALPRKDAAFAESWAASCACHTAVRDGAYLDESSALSLAAAAMSMPVHRCPHGRPIWFEMTRDDVLNAVKRT